MVFIPWPYSITTLCLFTPYDAQYHSLLPSTALAVSIEAATRPGNDNALYELAEHAWQIEPRCIVLKEAA